MTVSVDLDAAGPRWMTSLPRCGRFAGRPQELELPSAPMPPILVMDAKRPGRSRGSTPTWAAA